MQTYFDLNREIYQKVIIGNTELIDTFVSGKVNQVGMNNNRLGVGQFCSNSCEFVYRGNSIEWEGAKWQVISMQDENVALICSNNLICGENTIITTPGASLGYFYTNSVNYDGVNYTIKGYDVSNRMFEEFDVSKLPMDSIDVVNYICTYTGMNFESGTPWSNFRIESIPSKTTNMNLLGYIAGYDGMNVRVNNNGVLCKYWFNEIPIKVGRNEQYELGLNRELKKVVINSVKCGNYKAGSGYGLEIDNPFIKQTQVNQIYNNVKGFTYYKGEIKYRGNPRIEIGSIIQVETTTANYVQMVVMEQGFNIDGGMNATIKSYDNETQKIVMQYSPTDKKIEMAKSASIDFSQQVMNTIVGAGNGYYQVINSEGNPVSVGDTPVGWQDMNTPIVRNDTKGWRMVLGGLYHSNDGFKTYDTFALDENGNINASAIKVGDIDASIIGVKNLNADNITSGVIDSDRIAANSISVNKLTGNITESGWNIDLNEGTLTLGNISADNIQGGILKLGGANNIDGKLEVYDANNNLIGYWDKDNINLGNGETLINTSGEITTKSLTANDYIYVNGNNQSYFKIPTNNLEDVISYVELSKEGFINVYEDENNKVKINIDYALTIEDEVNNILSESLINAHGISQTIDDNGNRGFSLVNYPNGDPFLHLYENAKNTILKSDLISTNGVIKSEDVNSKEGVRIYTDTDGGNIRWYSPNGTYSELDSYNDIRTRIYSTNDTGSVEGTVSWTRTNTINLDKVLQNRGTIPTNADLNTYNSSDYNGVWYLATSTERLNMPFGETFGTLIVSSPYTTGSGACTQILMTNNTIYFRRFATSWQSWTDINHRFKSGETWSLSNTNIDCSGILTSNSKLIRFTMPLPKYVNGNITINTLKGNIRASNGNYLLTTTYTNGGNNFLSYGSVSVNRMGYGETNVIQIQLNLTNAIGSTYSPNNVPIAVEINEISLTIT